VLNPKYLPHIEKHSQFSSSTSHEGAFSSRRDFMIELCELFIVMMDVGQSLIVGIV
jgi:hypothetical protein